MIHDNHNKSDTEESNKERVTCATTFQFEETRVASLIVVRGRASWIPMLDYHGNLTGPPASPQVCIYSLIPGTFTIKYWRYKGKEPFRIRSPVLRSDEIQSLEPQLELAHWASTPAHCQAENCTLRVQTGFTVCHLWSLLDLVKTLGRHFWLQFPEDHLAASLGA